MTPPPPAGRLISPHVGTGNVVAAVCLGSGAAVSAAATVAARPVVAASSYLAASVAGYCLRRGCLHRLPTEGGGGQLGAAEVLRRHLTYEADWHLPDGSPRLGRLVHLLHVACWLLLFQPIYPVLEMALFPLDAAAFWFYYPKARGCGLVIDSRGLRREGKRGPRAQIFRLDWHRFELNVGKKYPPPNPGRHPPRVACNLPHIDLPQQQPGVRHWPWRQRTDQLMWLLPRPPPAPPSTVKP